VTFLAGAVIALPFVLLLLLWALEAIPTPALLPLITAPLAVRLGEVVSPRSGASRRATLRETLIFAAAFVALLALGLTVPVGAS
jgi:1,4-dihydroxy-2-naphthoate octaprenyltransferase